MNDEVTAAARAWQAQRRAGIVVAVAYARGSVPRAAGTRMLVDADAVIGSVGGGHLELKAIEHARTLLRPASAGGTGADRQRFALGPALGQCCGGAVELTYTPLVHVEPGAWPQPEPRFRLQLHGAGHVGRAVVKLLAEIDCRVQWVDGRSAEFPAEPLPAHIERVVTEAPADEVSAAPPGAAFLVMTHSHALDFDIVRAVLARGDRAWLGLIGSASKRAHFESRLRQRGVPVQALERMHCPVGIEGIAGKEPAVIAVAVVAQLLQAR